MNIGDVNPQASSAVLRALDGVALWSVERAALHLGISISTLNRLRCQGRGPKFAKLSGRILYRPSDLDAYVEASLYGSTSESPPRAA